MEMVYEFRLPDIGEGVAEGEVVKWLVKEGAEVKENQPLVEIMTDKVNVEIPSPRKGTVLRLMAKEGEVIKVGQVLLTIAEQGEQSAAPQEVTKDEGTPSPRTVGPHQTVMQTTPRAPIQIVQVEKKSREILATPATRKLARDLGVDLSLVQGTGPGGRITDRDVQSFRSGAMKPAVVTVGVAGGAEERIALRGIRRKIAERMIKSKHTAAHVTHVDEVDMTEIVQLREKAKASAEERSEADLSPLHNQSSHTGSEAVSIPQCNIGRREAGNRTQTILQHWNCHRHGARSRCTRTQECGTQVHNTTRRRDR